MCGLHTRPSQSANMQWLLLNDASQEKLQRRIAMAQIKVLQPPRAGKKCLVLDIDYTIFDLNSTAGMCVARAAPCMSHAAHTNVASTP